MTPYVDAAALVALAQRAEENGWAPCSCTKTPLDGWQSQPLSLDETRLVEVATLMREDDPEPTFAEYRPDNVQYWSPDAPIAPRYFPYNRCGVWECSECGRLYLRYTEGGGYFVDRRIRALKAGLVEDVGV
ncbi:hypothetical protein [Paraburkholderia hospita]|jgi:hypothetical protein|uniref:hypothetical protein n=1 Tax=Paraburkholderia TaxID=1822464 RepID=UPI0009A8D4AE|nr:hypothetical protein [Paraburkholderia hospita]OUL91207.1 hypothetical protein CA603_16300 [Paraburkholderia hospita]SKD00884.1 hypothetical protein SAMN05446934_8326 [Paraburkholderia hospita]SOE84158.1 hypothetical protein SAMN05446935_4586 [Burkholderia sp. YR290]HYS64751.1 hypothetical protein [Paraburkholderia sp.]